MAWQEFLSVFNWQQGEHVTMIGPTGSGKTSLGLHLINMRTYVTVLSTKPRDRTMDKLVAAGWDRQRTFMPELSNNIVLWPPVDGFSADAVQRATFREAMERILLQGGWCLDIDETAYISDFLGLEREVKMMMQIARSNDISIVNKTQRPAFVPLVIYDQATHLFFWLDNDENNLKRIGGLGGSISSKAVQAEVRNLPKHHFLYVNTRTGEKYRSLAPEVR